MSRLPLRVLVIVWAALVASCAAVGPKLEAPQLSLVSIQILAADMFAQKFKVRVKVDNPNDIEVPVTGLEYTIWLMGDDFAEGTTDHSFVLPALGEAEFDMTVTTNFVSSLGRLISRKGGGKLEDVEYQIDGKVFVDKGLLRKIPFSHKGTVDFSKAAK